MINSFQNISKGLNPLTLPQFKQISNPLFENRFSMPLNCNDSLIEQEINFYFIFGAENWKIPKIHRFNDPKIIKWEVRGARNGSIKLTKP